MSTYFIKFLFFLQGLNIQEAIQLYLEVRKEKGLPLTTEYFEVEVPVNT